MKQGCARPLWAIWLWVMALVAILAVNPGQASAQNSYIYTNNDVNGPNSVSAFLVGANGSLTPLPGSPFLTGGTGTGGGYFASNKAATTLVNNRLYIANTGNGTISGFTIDPATGILAQIAGGPWPTASGATGTVFGLSLAATQDGRYLSAAEGSSNRINVYAIAANGSLSPVTGSPFSGGMSPDGTAISPNGQLFVEALPSSRYLDVFMFGLDGMLTTAPAPPYLASALGQPTNVDISCQNNLLVAGGTSAIGSYNLAANGLLTPAPGTPYVTGAGSPQVVQLSRDDKLVFAANISPYLAVYSVASNGSLAMIPGSPFTAPGAAGLTGIATDKTGSFLYGANYWQGNIVGFSVAANGSLTPLPGSPFSTGVSGGLAFNQSLVAYPPKSCTVPTMLSLSAPVPAAISLGSANAVTLSATLTRTGGGAVAGASVAFTIDGTEAGTAITDDNGLATLAFDPSTLSAGLHTTAATAALQLVGGATYATSESGSQYLNVTVPTTLTVNPISPTPAGTTAASASAVLTRNDTGAPLVGAVITFSINDGTYGTSKTDASGMATLVFDTNKLSPGTNNVVASFDSKLAGEVTFEPSTGSQKLVITLPLTVAIIGSGSVSAVTTGTPATVDFPSSASAYISGKSEVALTPAAADHYEFSGWTGCDFVKEQKCVVSMIAAKAVTATFTLSKFAITFAADPHGTVTGEAAQTVTYGEPAAPVTAVPALGYTFANWTDGANAIVGTEPTLVVSSVTEAGSYRANFVDKTAPATTVVKNCTLGGGGWYVTPVGLSFTASDDGSGVKEIHVQANGGTFVTTAGASATLNLPSDGAHTVVYYAVDNDGNQEAPSTVTINIDTTAPVIKTTDIAASYPMGSAPTPGFTASDSHSGIASQEATLTGGGANGVGLYTYTVIATDIAGNQVKVVKTYSVVYRFAGFQAPVSLGKPFKLGSTVPVKFALTDGAGTPVTSATARFYLQKYQDNEPMGDPIEVTSTSGADTGNYFRVADGGYMYNLSTRGLSSGLYQIQAILDDGTTQTAWLELKS